MLEMFVIQQTLTKFDQISFLQHFRFKGNKRNFYYIEMPMMTPQISKSVDFTKTQKSRYNVEKATDISTNLQERLLVKGL